MGFGVGQEVKGLGLDVWLWIWDLRLRVWGSNAPAPPPSIAFSLEQQTTQSTFPPGWGRSVRKHAS